MLPRLWNQKMTEWLSDWVTDWQCHLLSCPGQLKMAVIWSGGDTVSKNICLDYCVAWYLFLKMFVTLVTDYGQCSKLWSRQSSISGKTKHCLLLVSLLTDRVLSYHISCSPWAASITCPSTSTPCHGYQIGARVERDLEINSSIYFAKHQDRKALRRQIFDFVGRLCDFLTNVWLGSSQAGCKPVSVALHPHSVAIQSVMVPHSSAVFPFLLLLLCKAQGWWIVL